MPDDNHRKDGTFRTGHTAAQIGPEPADSIITLRVPRSLKGRLVRASRAVPGQSLSRWLIRLAQSAAFEYERENGIPHWISPASVPDNRDTP